MKRYLLAILLFSCFSAGASDSLYTIRINFLYGSRPADGFKDAEPKLFGGIKGGHVSITAGDMVLDFMPGDNPLFPNYNNPSGGFRINNKLYWDTTSAKWKSVIVPVSEDQFSALQFLFKYVSEETPYDYAIFGMRCAAASYDILCKIGLFKEYDTRIDIAKFFYPKLLRKKILKWAEENNYTVLSHKGKSSRKWESDNGLF